MGVDGGVVGAGGGFGAVGSPCGFHLFGVHGVSGMGTSRKEEKRETSTRRELADAGQGLDNAPQSQGAEWGSLGSRGKEVRALIHAQLGDKGHRYLATIPHPCCFRGPPVSGVAGGVRGKGIEAKPWQAPSPQIRSPKLVGAAGRAAGGIPGRQAQRVRLTPRAGLPAQSGL